MPVAKGTQKSPLPDAKSSQKTPTSGMSAQKGQHGNDHKKTSSRPCPNLCAMIPTNVPGPDAAQTVLHPHKDVFVLKVAKIGPNGDRRCKMELELVTPKCGKKVAYRIDTKGTQCDPTCECCVCDKPWRKK